MPFYNILGGTTWPHLVQHRNLSNSESHFCVIKEKGHISIIPVLQLRPYIQSSLQYPSRKHLFVLPKESDNASPKIPVPRAMMQ